MKLALEALIDDAAIDDDNANDNDNTNDAYNNNDEVRGIVVVGFVSVVIIYVVGVVINVFCFGSTGLYWSYLEGGPCKTKG